MSVEPLTCVFNNNFGISFIIIVTEFDLIMLFFNKSDHVSNNFSIKNCS